MAKLVSSPSQFGTSKSYPLDTKIHFFVIDKFVEDAKQGQKVAPDPVESIIKESCLVKEELRQILFKFSQFGPQIVKIKVSTFWIPEI